MKVKIWRVYADKVAKKNGFSNFREVMNYIKGTQGVKYNNRNLELKDFVRFMLFCHLKDIDLIRLKLEIKNYGIKKISK